MKKLLQIGRNPDNDITLNFPQVSGKHAALTIISASSLLIEDLGSTNGTFVNGLKVKRSVLSPSDEVKVANVKLDLSAYFRQPVAEKSDASSANDYTKAFAKLEEVYLQYENARKAIKKGDMWKKTALRAGLSLIPFVGNAIAIMVCEGISNDEKLQALDAEFKTNYVCPKCKNFLGYFPFAAVAAKKSCMYCKAVWVK